MRNQAPPQKEIPPEERGMASSTEPAGQRSVVGVYDRPERTGSGVLLTILIAVLIIGGLLAALWIVL